eukprot:50301-Prymnesium_polylepis.1
MDVRRCLADGSDASKRCVGGVHDVCKRGSGLVGPYCMTCPRNSSDDTYWDPYTKVCIACTSIPSSVVLLSVLVV